MHIVTTGLLLAVSATLLTSGDASLHTPGWKEAALARLGKVVESLQDQEASAMTSHDDTATERLRRVAEVLQSYRFHLLNGKVTDESPKRLATRMLDEVRTASMLGMGSTIEGTLESLLSEAPESWEVTSSISEDCPDTASAPELALDELTAKCTKGGGFYDVLGCLGAATMYCHRMFPLRSTSELVGLITDRDGSVLTIACIERGQLIFGANSDDFRRHCPPVHVCSQIGAEVACQFHHGANYGGAFVDVVSLKALGEDFQGFMATCFPATKQFDVDFVKLHTEHNKDCHAGNPVNNYSCLKAASSYCKDHFGYSGGVVQAARSPQTAAVACYNAFYIGEAYISKDSDFLQAKRSLKKICSLDFEVDIAKILNANPEVLHTGVFDNRRSSVELRDIFTVSKSVTTENRFDHSHEFNVGVSVTKKVGIPFIAGAKVTVSASYTATVSLGKTNSETTQYSHTSEVFVPPGMGVAKKAIITRTSMSVPWRAVGLNGLGRRVELSGTWHGVDVSDIRVQQEDL